MTDLNPVQIVAQINAAMDDMKKTNAQLNETLKADIAAASAEGKEAKAKAEELAGKLQKASANMLELEQKLADGVKEGKTSVNTLGQMVIKSDAYKQFAAGNSRYMRVEANTITGQEGSPPENSDILVPAQRLAGIIPGAFRSLRVRDLVPNGTTTSNAVEYAKEKTFTNAAQETAEGAQKAEATLDFELVSAPVRTIAHFLKVSKQVLEDAPALQSYVDGRLRYGVELRYETQILKGNGSGQNISGMTNSGNFTAFTPVTGDKALDSLNRAIEKVALEDYAATGIVLNPADWHAIERLKDNEERYIYGNPGNAAMPMLWGLPVVVTNTMTAGKLLVAGFDIAYQVWNRSGVVVEMFEQDDTNVQKNLLTVRAEARGTLATYTPKAAQYGDLTL